MGDNLKKIIREHTPDEIENQDIFTEIGISWESIVPVEETVPDLRCGKWDEHLEQESAADTLGN